MSDSSLTRDKKVFVMSLTFKVEEEVKKENKVKTTMSLPDDQPPCSTKCYPGSSNPMRLMSRYSAME